MKRKKSIKSLVQAYDPGILKISEYCTRHGFTVASFYYWRKKFQEEEPSFVAIQPIVDKVQTIHLRLPSGIEVHLPHMSRRELMEWTLELEQAHAKL